ncbi:MAG: DUF3494 domain-containing protein [Verrucomicrobiaceae bacterium]|nr:MAG: DUF3494 domain-containing protein [Verrucomicrobiaceae bacterium]
MQKRTRHIITSSFLTISMALALAQSVTAASVLTVNLGGAGEFGVLAGAGITIAGPLLSSQVTGSVGSYPTGSITGLENLIHTGLNHGSGLVVQNAKDDLTDAYNDAASRVATTSLADGFVLTGTLVTGVYKSAGSFALNSVLTLDAEGDPNAVWIFQMVSSLNTATTSQVVLINGAQASNVFWQVGSSAVLAGNSNFTGTILAQESITLNSGTQLSGAAMARTGAVTLTSSVVAIPEVSSLVMAGVAAGLFAFRRSRIRR